MEKINRIKEIAIIDDHSIVIEGLRTILKSYPSLLIDAYFTKGNQVIDYMQTKKPDLYIVDIDLPDMDGITLVQKIKEKDQNSKIVIFTQHEGEFYFKETQFLGVNAYILKSENLRIIPDILMKVFRGEHYISPELYKYQRNDDGGLGELEHSIVKLLVNGSNLKEIAIALDKTEKAIEYRLHKIRDFFDAKTNGELGYKIRLKYFK